MENTIELITEPDGSVICLHNDQVLFFFEDELEADKMGVPAVSDLKAGQASK
jgi:hypothetical protein